MPRLIGVAVGLLLSIPDLLTSLAKSKSYESRIVYLVTPAPPHLAYLLEAC